MYNLNNSSSDDDYLYLYTEDKDNLKSVMWEHHQLQFKDEKIDYNFSTVQSFIRNILTGGSTINFEVIWSKELIGTPLEFLSEYKESFINYNIIKSYLGMAKRDLKYYRKDTKGLRYHTKETNKKLSHFVRGVIFAKMLINNNFNVSLEDSHTFKEMKSDMILLKSIKSDNCEQDYNDIIIFFEKEMNIIRDILSERLQSDLIQIYMKPDILCEIDEKIKQLTCSNTKINYIYIILSKTGI